MKKSSLVLALGVAMLTTATSGFAQSRSKNSGPISNKYFSIPQMNGWKTDKVVEGPCEGFKAELGDQFVNIMACPVGRRSAKITAAEAAPILNALIAENKARFAVAGCKSRWQAPYASGLSSSDGMQNISQCDLAKGYMGMKVAVYQSADLEVKVASRLNFPYDDTSTAGNGTEITYFLQWK